MFNILSFTSLALAAASSVSGLVVPRASPPPGWQTDYLEPYTTYHVRYLALDCQDQHSKPFFNQCCHPLLATEKLETARPPQCIPSASASSSASAAEPTSTVTTPADDGGDECEDGDDETSTAVAPAPAPTNAPSSDDSGKPAAAVAPAPTSTTPKANPTPDASADTSSSNLITGGVATFFFQNGVAGACGTVHKDSDLIAAIDVQRYGNTGVKSSLCGKQVKIINPANKKSVTVVIADACPTCNNGNSIDLSQGAFDQIAQPEQGEVPIQWSFV
jgi:hypothetical protein